MKASSRGQRQTAAAGQAAAVKPRGWAEGRGPALASVRRAPGRASSEGPRTGPAQRRGRATSGRRRPGRRGQTAGPGRAADAGAKPRGERSVRAGRARAAKKVSQPVRRARSRRAPNGDPSVRAARARMAHAKSQGVRRARARPFTRRNTQRAARPGTVELHEEPGCAARGRAVALAERQRPSRAGRERHAQTTRPVRRARSRKQSRTPIARYGSCET